MSQSNRVLTPWRKGVEAFFTGFELCERPEELVELAGGFAAYDHRDARGRNAIDLFLEKAGPELTEEQRGVFAGIAGARCGTFEVVSCRPGSSLVARCFTREERFEIVDTHVSRTLAPGVLFFCRLVPYRGRYELIPPLLVHPERLAYALRRLAREGRPDLL